MGSACTYAESTFLLKNVSSLGKSSCCVDHIVHDNDILSFHVTDSCNRCYHVSSLSGLVADDDRACKFLCISICPLGTTHIRSSDCEIFDIQ